MGIGWATTLVSDQPQGRHLGGRSGSSRLRGGGLASSWGLRPGAADENAAAA